MLRTELVLSIEHQLWFLLPAAHWTYAYYETGSGLELWPCSRPQPALGRHRTHQAVPALFYDAITQTRDVTQVRYCGKTPYSLSWQNSAFNTNQRIDNNCKQYWTVNKNGQFPRVKFWLINLTWKETLQVCLHYLHLLHLLISIVKRKSQMILVYQYLLFCTWW